MTKYRQITETGLIVAAISDLELSTETVSYYVNFRIAVLGIFWGKKSFQNLTTQLCTICISNNLHLSEEIKTLLFV